MSTARKKNVGPPDSRPWSPGPISEENMRRLDRLANLGTLSAGLAHEIKNGLTAIKTFIELQLKKTKEKELAAVVSRELNRIDSMVSQMLRFAAPKAAAFSTVRVHEVLDHSLRLLQHQIASRMIFVTRDFRAAPDTARGDEAQLQQVFMNLLLNAVEAMGMNGRLTIITETIEKKPGERRLRIQIQDTGMGIAPENLPRLFEPFFTTKKNGTGLGLAISQRIAGEHQGVIEAHSNAGKGSTFNFWLPASEA